MQTPTIVVLTDRNDLDDQLFGQFQRCHEILRQMPVQASDRDHLSTLLQVASGGVVFTTIQKFLPDLIRLAKEMDAATKRGVDLGLNEDEGGPEWGGA